ncbi:ABC transporter ATP-binding protein [Nakamurella deserti]|uniref:ABC transporter ATP-binding protein n=1 Tax=Nakamurella deserti TaxID=2164074 RepID=UPI000DBE90F4|nr:ABC transporter ATP-binding protein [Nakamurella deserti]
MTAGTELHLPTATTRDAWRTVRALLRPRQGRALATLVLLTVANAVALLAPPLVGHIVDLVLAGEPASAITVPAALLLAVALGQGVFGTLGAVLVAHVGEESLAELRETVMARALQLPLARIERGGTGDLVARVSGDVAVLAGVTRVVVPAVTGSALTVGLTFVGLAALDWRFALAGLLAVPIQLDALRWYLRRSGPVYAAERVAEGARTQQLLDSLGGVQTVHAFGLADQHVGAVTRTSQQAVDLALRAARMASIFFGRLNYAEFVGMAAILTAGFWMVDSGAATVGTATAAALYFHRLFDPINTLLALFDEAQQGLAGLARLVGVIRTPLPPPPAAPAAPVDGSLTVDGVEFGYAPGSSAVRGVSLTVADGEHVALVGASGAGKTTLAKLIAGVHPVRGGRVLLGGVALDQIEPHLLRASVALISQESYVFAGSLADDLRLAAPTATDAALDDALRRVGAGDWFDRLPDGLATAVGEGGTPLTAAQSQQLALARLILADPRMAILDEATADAGSAGARRLDAAAVEALRGRTALIVAHRLSQAVTADRIVVMDDGRIVETGTHDALITTGGPYAALWSSWSRARRVD